MARLSTPTTIPQPTAASEDCAVMIIAPSPSMPTLLGAYARLLRLCRRWPCAPGCPRIPYMRTLGVNSAKGLARRARCVVIKRLCCLTMSRSVAWERVRVEFNRLWECDSSRRIMPQAHQMTEGISCRHNPR